MNNLKVKEKMKLMEEQMQEIHNKRMLIERIKANNVEKLISMKQQLSDSSPEIIKKSLDKTKVNYRELDLNKKISPPKPVEKNSNVSDTDKMLFDKRFKNFLNHKQEYIDKARNKAKANKLKKNGQAINLQSLADAQYYNEQQVLSNTGSDYQYRDANDMQQAYTQMTTGKKRKGAAKQLFHCQYYENQFRKGQFENLLTQSSEQQQNILSISKDRFLNYLFDQPSVMMLYSINPYLLGDQLAEFQTKNNQYLDYLEFSRFLLLDREPTYFQYSRENLLQARQLGRGIKCAPIIGKWIDQTGIYELLIETYKDIDMHGDGKIDKTFLATKLKHQAEKRRLTEIQVIEIVNINKKIPLNRLLYQIQYQDREDGDDWTFQQFQQFLNNYKRRDTPQKDKLITRLILAGKYDPSYVYILSQQIIEIIKQIFKQTPKFAQYFVLKQKFLQNICKDPRYKRIQSMSVRSQANRYVKKQNLQQTLIRVHAQGQQYLDLEEILDFLTNRGRPKLVQYKVYIQNLERQIQLIEEDERLRLEKYGQGYQTTSSDEQYGQIIKKKRIQRKKNKLLKIRQDNAFNHGKKFNVTIPIPFGFDTRDKHKKLSIRQRKIQEMLDEKARQQAQSMQLFRAKQVPKHVKDNLYEKMLKDEARERKERLERFRLEIMSQVHVSQSLMRPKSTEIHCDFGSGKQYKFVARPMPWYCQVNLLDRINKKKIQRKQKIFQQIFNRNKDFDLPEGVQRMIERQEQLKSKRDAKRTASTGSVGQCTFMPRITDQVPDFKTKHQHLHFYLQNAKHAKQPITIQPFSFENRPAKSRTTYQPPKKIDIRHSKYQKAAQNNEDYTNIPKTQKFEALVQLRRKQTREKEHQVLKQKKSEAIRRLREQKFAPIVRKVLKQNAPDMSKSRGIIADKIKEFKREQKRKKMEYENQMIKIYTKVFQRPLLIQNGGIQQKQSRTKSPTSKPKDSQLKKSKPAQGQLQNEEYLQNYYGNIQNPRGSNNQRNFQGANYREEHPPGQYPMQDYDEQENEVNQSDLYEQQYEQGGNIHTS